MTLVRRITVWFAIHIRCLANERKGTSTSDSFLSNIWSFRSTIIGILFPRVTPNSATISSPKTCCDVVSVPALQSPENRQPSHHRNSSRLLMGTSWFRSSQPLAQLLFGPNEKHIVLHVLLPRRKRPPSPPQTYHTRISLTQIKPNATHDAHLVMAPLSRRLLQVMQTDIPCRTSPRTPLGGVCRNHPLVQTEQTLAWHRGGSSPVLTRTQYHAAGQCLRRMGTGKKYRKCQKRLHVVQSPFLLIWLFPALLYQNF